MVAIHRRYLVLGLDGGTFDLLDPLMAAGELPFLKSLVQRGARATLRSVYPAKTIPAWYSFATGQDPGELGIFGFTEPGDAPGHSKLIQSFRPQEAFWDRLSRLGRKVGVLNFPIASPYPLHGFVLPGMLAERPSTYPAGLRAEVESAIGAPYPAELPPFHAATRDAWVAQATEAVTQRARAAATLAERHRPDFLFALFRETDRIEHQHWADLARPVGEIPADLRAFWRAVDQGCHDVDAAFRSGGGAPVTLVISDHGHGAVHSDFLTNRWLAEEKLLVFRRAHAADRRRRLSRLILKVQRLPLGARVSRRLAEVLREGHFAEFAALLGGGASFEELAGEVDWKRTVAFSYPVPEGIYLNPFNPSLTPERRAGVLAEIRSKLERYPEARIEVLPPEDIYRGRNLGRAPALLIRIDGMTTEPRMDLSYHDPLIRDRPEFFYGSGCHRMDGILIAAGDGIRPGARPGRLSLLDVGPTVLEGMGVPAGAGTGGRSFAAELAA
jgi:predicted AlkP superfamily phosphohydrolase/phosphomutase